MKNLIDFVREIEADLVDLLKRKELGRYALNKGFDRIKARIIEITSELEDVVKILTGEV